jgi:hypothetical protein
VRHNRDVSFTEFLAYQTILANLPSLCSTIISASEIKVTGFLSVVHPKGGRWWLGGSRGWWWLRLSASWCGQSGPLSKDDFKVASRVLNRPFSRVESDIVFELFDLDDDGFISPDDSRSVALSISNSAMMS